MDDRADGVVVRHRDRLHANSLSDLKSRATGLRSPRQITYLRVARGAR